MLWQPFLERGRHRLPSATSRAQASMDSAGQTRGRLTSPPRCGIRGHPQRVSWTDSGIAACTRKTSLWQSCGFRSFSVYVRILANLYIHLCPRILVHWPGRVPGRTSRQEFCGPLSWVLFKLWPFHEKQCRTTCVWKSIVVDQFGQLKRKVGAWIMLGGQPYHSQPRHIANVVLRVISTRDALKLFFLNNTTCLKSSRVCQRTPHQRIQPACCWSCDGVGLVASALLAAKTWRSAPGRVTSLPPLLNAIRGKSRRASCV